MSKTVERVNEGLRFIFGRGLALRCTGFVLNSLAVGLLPLDWYGVVTLDFALFTVICGWVRVECLHRVAMRALATRDAVQAKVTLRNLIRLSFWISQSVIAVAFAIWYHRVPTAAYRLPRGPTVFRVSLILHAFGAFLAASMEGMTLELCRRELHCVRMKQDAALPMINTGLLLTIACTARVLRSPESAHSGDLTGLLLVFLSGVAALLGPIAQYMLARNHVDATWDWRIAMSNLESPSITRPTKIHAQNCQLTSLPHPLHLPVWFPEDTCRLLWMDAVGCGQQFVLAEGDKLVMMWRLTETQKGRLGAVLQLGGIIPRLVFRPQEDVVHTHYAVNWGEDKSHTGVPQNCQIDFTALRNVFTIQASLGLCCTLLGPLHGHAALRALYGPTRADILWPMFAR